MSRQTPGAEVGLAAMAAYSIAVLAIPAAHLAYELIPAGILLLAWIRVGGGIRSALARFLALEVLLVGFGIGAALRPEMREPFLVAVVKSHLCLGAATVLTRAYSATDLLSALRRLGCPALAADVIALMWRYLPLMQEESRRLQRARASRTFVPARRLKWRLHGDVVALLFLRGLARAERVYMAMSSRGWK
ncbi:cobalt transport protein [mine drainage metagenome]|uniref:Cobalt transport protein n=1 Tax=mine drainage metagenome TaxID=410659 RepID=A0A1J5SYE9_9ZZZZ